MIKIKKHAYNKQADATYFEFSDRKVYKTKEVKEGIIVDYDKDGLLVGVEVLNAKNKRVSFGFVIPKKEIEFSAGREKLRLPAFV